MLEERYPARVLLVKYEDLALNSSTVAEAIYRFLNLQLPQAVSKWITVHTNKMATDPYSTTRNSTETAYRWRHQLSKEIIQKITEICNSTLQTYQYEL